MLQGWPSLLSFPQVDQFGDVLWGVPVCIPVYQPVKKLLGGIGRVFFGWNVFVFINYDEVWSIPPQENDSIRSMKTKPWEE